MSGRGLAPFVRLGVLWGIRDLQIQAARKC